MAEADPAVEVLLGGRWSRRFESFEEVKQWVAEERSRWNWLREVPDSPGRVVAAQAWQAMSNAWRQVDDSVTRAQASTTEGTLKAVRVALTNVHLVPSESAEGRFLENERLRNIESAAGAAVSLLSLLLQNLQSTHVLRGIVAAKLFEEGVSVEAVAARAASLDETIGDGRKLIAKLAEQSEEAARALAEFKAGGEVERKGHGDLWVTETVAMRKAQEKYLADAASELEAIKRDYEEQMKVAAPVQYWSGRKDYHRLWAKVFAVGFAVLLACTVLVVYWLAGTMVVPELLWWKAPAVQAASTAAGKGTKELQIESVAILLLLVTPLLWGIRMVARNLVSHSHLATDAAERVTMIQTYLALLKDKKVEEDDRKQILSSLFRPGATGLVQEELGYPAAEAWKSFTGK